MRLIQFSIALAILAISAVVIADYDLSWHKIAGGGETFSTGGDYFLSGTIGQHDAGAMCGGTYEITSGFWAGTICPTLVGDLSCDGVVNVSDLLILLSEWGPCPDCNACPADLNRDCIVNVNDLLILLGLWG